MERYKIFKVVDTYVGSVTMHLICVPHVNNGNTNLLTSISSTNINERKSKWLNDMIMSLANWICSGLDFTKIGFGGRIHHMIRHPFFFISVS